MLIFLFERKYFGMIRLDYSRVEIGMGLWWMISEKTVCNFRLRGESERGQEKRQRRWGRGRWRGQEKWWMSYVQGQNECDL